MICSETTPSARKAAHARPAPRPNLLVKVEAIQSVESAVVTGVVAGLVGFCCWPLTDAAAGGSEDVILKGGVGDCGCEGGVGGGGGGGV